MVFSFTNLSKDGSQHVNMVHWLLLVYCAALLSTGLNLTMFFTWPADTLILVWLPLLQLQCAGGNNSRKIITNKQKHVVSASFSILFYSVKIPREIYLRYQTSHK